TSFSRGSVTCLPSRSHAGLSLGHSVQNPRTALPFGSGSSWLLLLVPAPRRELALTLRCIAARDLHFAGWTIGARGEHAGATSMGHSFWRPSSCKRKRAAPRSIWRRRRHQPYSASRRILLFPRVAQRACSKKAIVIHALHKQPGGCVVLLLHAGP